MKKVKFMMKSRCMKVSVGVFATMLAVLPLTADCVSLDLGGVWHATENGIDADVKLPGTLADSQVGEEQDYAKWRRV